MNEESTTTQTEPSDQRRYNLIVGGLMVLILVSLAGLWITERGRRNRAENAAAAAQTATAGQQKNIQALAAMLVDSSTEAVIRGELPTKTVKWNERDRTVLLLGAEAGRKLGFNSGDVIEITPAAPPATPAGKNEKK